MGSFARYWLPPLLWMALIWSASSDLGSADNTAGPFGWILATIGSLVATVGAIAMGVRWGMELTDYDRQQRAR